MQLPFTLRLAYHSFRATVRAGLLLLSAWLFLIPANANEVAALGAREGTTYPTGLRMMRVARVVVKAAPPRAYSVIALAAGRDVSPLMVQVAMVQMASGNVLPATARRAGEGTNDSDRDIEGPRFIKTN